MFSPTFTFFTVAALAFSPNVASSFTPPTGARTIRPMANQSMCLTADTIAQSAAVGIGLCDNDYRSTQIWNFGQYNSTDPYEGGWNIMMGNMCLDVTGDNHQQGTHLQLWPCLNDEAQAWFPSDGGQ